MLAERIRQIYLETEEIYGAPRIYSELKLGDGIQIGKKRVARHIGIEDHAIACVRSAVGTSSAP
jgi:HTH-like domain